MLNRVRAMAILTALALGAIGIPAVATAQLSRDKQDCIAAFAKGITQVRKAQGTTIRHCLKRFASGTLVSTTPEACLLVDSRNKVMRAADKTTTAELGICAQSAPGFAVSASPAAIVMAAGRNIELVRRIISSNLDTGLVPVAADARCQVRVVDAVQKCVDTRMTEYNKCLKDGMADGVITNAATLQANCLGTSNATQLDPKGRIALRCERKIALVLENYCFGIDLGRAFLGCQPTDAQNLATCLKRESACEVCQLLNAVSGLSRECDAFDDGDPSNGTCGDECSDGIVQLGEGCDDGNTNDGDGCSSECKVEVNWGCTGQPSTCTLNCGNGAVDSSDGEQCDDGNLVSGDGCSSSCLTESCGDSTLDIGETCDDGGFDDEDGCSALCQTEPGYLCTGQPSVCEFVCGNGTFQGVETCDDGNIADGDGCSGVCKTENGYTCAGQPSVCSAVCGDGRLRPGEGCDDGNLLNSDGCANSCNAETGYQCSGEPSVCTSVCGDSLVRYPETCDDGDSAGGDGCSASCQPEPNWSCTGQPSVCQPTCGNGIVNPTEQCDDGNAVSGDGCGPCTIEPGYACAGQPSFCYAICSNGRIESSAGELCDDGNVVNGDGCSGACLIEPGFVCNGEPSVCGLTCSNGLVQPSLGEQCDDGNQAIGDGCDNDCQVEFAYACVGQPSMCHVTCGDGVTEPARGELCDDGNTIDGDGCDAACITEPGWYCSGGACEEFDVVIDSPAHGAFNAGATAVISGHYTQLPGNQVSLLINGVPPNTSFNPETRTFAHTLTLNHTIVFNPVTVLAINTQTGDDVRARSVVIAGGSVADGGFSPESVALRLNESGLASVQPLVADLAGSGFNIAALMPSNTTLVDQCFIDVGFLGCWGRARVGIADPPPSVGGIGLTTDARPGVVHGDISVNSLRVDIAINGSGLVPSCGLRLSADRMTIGGDYALEPAAMDPSHVDVNLVGPMSVNFAGFNRRFTWGICTWPIIGDIIGAVLPNVENMASSAIQGFLNDPDGSGPQKSPVAEGIESALDGVNLSGAVGQGVGLSFDAPLFKIEEDHAGLTLGAHSRFQVSIGTGLGQCNPPPGAPDLSASYSKYEPFPALGANTPQGGRPYGLGIAISTAGFNQLLKGQTECGLMRSSLSTIDIDGPGGSPAAAITSDLLSLFVPEFAELPPGTPLRIDLSPTLAPIVTGNYGPGGEVAELRIAQLAVNIVQPGTGDVWLRGAFDARLGMDLAFLPDGSGLAITINKPAIDDVTISVVDNPLGADEASIETVLPNIMAPMIPSLAGALSGFPLPQFFGLRIQGVEVSRSGQFLSLFANLVP